MSTRKSPTTPVVSLDKLRINCRNEKRLPTWKAFSLFLNLNLGGPCRARTYDPLIKSPSGGVIFEPIEPNSSHKRASFGTNPQGTMVKSWGPIEPLGCRKLQLQPGFC